MFEFDRSKAVKQALLLFLLAAPLLANPLTVRPPRFFSQTVSIQVDFIPLGVDVSLEVLTNGYFKPVCTYTNAGSPSLVFILPLSSNQVYRASYL